MAYTVTPLGLKLATPSTLQAWETTVINNNFQLLEDAITADTGWITLPLSGIVTPATEFPQYRRMGLTVALRGAISGAGFPINQWVVIGTLPAGFLPTKYDTYPTSNQARMAQLSVTTGGDVRIWVSDTTSASWPLSGIKFWQG